MLYSGSIRSLVFFLLTLAGFISFDLSANTSINKSTFLLPPRAIQFFVEAEPLTVYQLHEYEHRFSPWQPALLTDEEKKHTLWLRFTLNNNTQLTVNPMLYWRFQQHIPVSFYLKTESGITPLLLSQLNTIAFSLLPEQTAVIYLKTSFHPELASSLEIGSFDQIMKWNNLNQWRTGLIGGLLISILVVNLWIFRLTKIEDKNYRLFRLLLAGAAFGTLTLTAAWQGHFNAGLHLSITLEEWIYKFSVVIISLILCQVSVTLFGEEKPPLICLLYILSLLYLCATLWLPLADNTVLPPSLMTLVLLASAGFFLYYGLKKQNHQHSAWLIIPLSLTPLLFALNHSGALITSSQDSTLLLTLALVLILGLLSFPRQIHRKSSPKESRLSASVEPFDNEIINSLGCEMRTPLNGLMGMSELLLSTQLSPKQKNYIKTLRYAGFEMGNLISLLMNTIKTTDQIKPSSPRPINIDKLTNKLIKRFHYRAQQQNIALDYEIDDNVTTICHIADQQITLVLEALLFHTLNLSPPGQVTLYVNKTTQDKLTFELRLQNNDFNAKHLLHKGSFSETRAEIPTGLHLYLAFRLLGRLSGEVSQNGNNILLTLPISSEPGSASLSNTKSQTNYQNLRVLIAGSSKTCRIVLAQQCHIMGISFVEVENGLKALAMIRSEDALQRAFDAVILDQHLLGMRGLRIAKWVHNNSDIKTKPALILLTGVNSPADKAYFRRLGIHSILNKPASLFCLERALKKALHRNSKKQQCYTDA